MKITLTIATVVAVLSLAVYFAATSPSGRQVAASAASSAPAPDFTLEKVGGGTLSLSDYKGIKPVILDFWATWCPNCRRDIPRQQRFYEKYKDQVEVIGINLQENPSTVARFISDNGVTYQNVLDPRSQVSRAYNVQYTNYHILIDKDGNVVRAVPGDIRESDFQSLAAQS